MENLSLVKRESPLGGEDNTITAKSDDLSNAPKLPPKPGKPQIFQYPNYQTAYKLGLKFCAKIQIKSRSFIFPAIFVYNEMWKNSNFPPKSDFL